ncbi:MAG: hypothetical protein AABX08_00310 [Nanoarchaeota archaeon]
MVKNKSLGIALIVISIIFLISVILFKIQINNLAQVMIKEFGGICIKDGICIHQQTNLPVYLGIVAIIITFLSGLYLFFEKTIIKPAEKITKEIDFSKLDLQEKNIYDLLKSKNGSAYQSDLIKETQLSKVKITRILDKLESKNVVERKRRGMTNMVFLK